MKDPDSSSDVKKEENAEDMSLADLLGGGDDSSSDEPKRVDHRADEPDSGMVNLAKMVAGSSVEVARTPSIMPPPMEADASGRDPSGVVQTQAGIPAPTQGEKKSQGPLFALIAVVIVAVLAIGYFATRNGDDDGIKAALEAERAALEADRKANQDAMAQMMAKLAEMDRDKGSADEATSKEMAALKAELEAAKAKDADLAAKEAEAAAQKEEETAKAKTDKPKKTTTKPKKVDTTPKTVTPKKKVEKKTPKKKKSGTSELDSLLSGPKKEKPKTAPANDLAKKPTKAEVKKAMGPVQVRAQKSCAKYSTGTVQVQVVVKGSNGRVKSASPKGAFAGNQAGKCVAMMARSAKFPKFSDSTFSFTYPIILK